MSVELTPDALLAARAGWTRGFAEAYAETSVWYPMVSTNVSSSTKQNTYGWALNGTGMREWLGERIAQNLAAASYALENQKWELTVEIDRDDFEDDNLGVHDMWIAQNGESARKHKDELFRDLLQNGHSTLCFDGQNFYDTDHPVAQNDSSYGTWSNYYTSTALSKANFRTVRTNMLSRKNEANRSIASNPGLLQIPPALEGVAEDILLADKDGGGDTNTTRGKADILVTPDLAGQDTTWYLHDVSRRIKPFVDQNRRPLAINSITDPRSERVFMNGKFILAIDARYAAGYTVPHLSSKAAA